MLKYSLILIGIVPAVVAGAQTFDQATIASNPVAYWRFEAPNDNDLINGYSSTMVGNAAITGAGGGAPLAGLPSNHALDLTQGGYVTTGLSSQQTLSNGGTMAAWVNLAALSSTLGRIEYVCGKSQYGNDWDMQIQQDDKAYFYVNGGSHVTTTQTLGTNQWVWLTASLDESTGISKIYVNGVLDGTANTGGHAPGGNQFTIGESLVFSGRQFDGLIDEVTLWDHPLTDSQIANLYASAQAAPEPFMAVVPILGVLLFGLKRRSA